MKAKVAKRVDTGEESYEQADQLAGWGRQHLLFWDTWSFPRCIDLAGLPLRLALSCSLRLSSCPSTSLYASRRTIPNMYVPALLKCSGANFRSIGTHKGPRHPGRDPRPGQRWHSTGAQLLGNTYASTTYAGGESVPYYRRVRRFHIACRSASHDLFAATGQCNSTLPLIRCGP